MKAQPTRWTRRERAIVARLTTPAAVQDYLDTLPYCCEDGHLTRINFARVIFGKNHPQ